MFVSLTSPDNATMGSICTQLPDPEYQDQLAPAGVGNVGCTGRRLCNALWLNLGKLAHTRAYSQWCDQCRSRAERPGIRGSAGRNRHLRVRFRSDKCARAGFAANRIQRYRAESGDHGQLVPVSDVGRVISDPGIIRCTPWLMEEQRQSAGIFLS